MCIGFKDNPTFSEPFSLTIPTEVEYEEHTYKVTAIGPRAFYNNRYISGVIWPEELQTIGSSAFAYSSLESIGTFPTTLTTIEDNAFQRCLTLDGALIFQEGIKTIGNNAFTQCRLSGGLFLPESIESIGDGAFSGCAFQGTLTLPEGLTTIGNNVFRDCSFEALNLPSTLTSIGNGTFSNCWFKCELKLPEGLKSIGQQAFAGCDQFSGS